MKFAHMTNAVYDFVRSMVMCYHRKRIYAIMSMSSVLSIIVINANAMSNYNEFMCLTISCRIYDSLQESLPFLHRITLNC